jgi:hypothetical protein
LVFTALVLFCCTTISRDATQNAATPTTLEAKMETVADRAVPAKPSKADSPTPKVAADPSSKGSLELGAGEASPPAIQPGIKTQVKPAIIMESYETPRQRKIWYGLMVLAHGTAAFDAWTTRRAVSGGYGVEGDPMQRPFANSGAIYATTQVTPLLMDLLAHQMLRSSHPMIRKAWWVPQTASAGVSLGAGIHNYSVVP